VTAHAEVLDAHGRRLLWRCRRGMKELDILLERYVRSQVAQASPQDRATLDQLLELPDPVLADHLFGHTPVSDPRMASLVAAIRSCPPGAGPGQVGPAPARVGPAPARVGEYL
jgi:antitoxin CptB